MIIFDVRCKVLKPIRYTGKDGRPVEIQPGVYRLRGLDPAELAALTTTNAARCFGERVAQPMSIQL